MIHKELYIGTTKTNKQLVDTDKFEIVRIRKTPYFNIELKQDGSYGTVLPLTEKTRALFGYCEGADMNTSIPYDYLYADYYVDSMPIFTDAEVRILDPNNEDGIEVQFVYGVNREKYLPLFEKKLNEIAANGTTVLESDWIAKWDLLGIAVTDKKYEYIDYVKRERVSDVITKDGIVQPKVEPDSPMLENQDAMAHHPFVSFNEMLDLIIIDNYNPVIRVAESNPINNEITFYSIVTDDLKIGDRMYSLDGNKLTGSNIIGFDGDYTVIFDEDVSTYFADFVEAVFVQKDIADFTSLKERLTNKGLILGGNKDDYKFSRLYNYPQYSTEPSTKLYLGNINHSGILSFSDYYVNHLIGGGGIYNIKVAFNLDFAISGVLGLTLCRSYYDVDTSTTIEEVLQIIPNNGTDIGGFLQYKTEVYAEVSSSDDKTYSFYIRLDTGVIGAVGYEFRENSKITVSYAIETSVFRYLDYLDNSFGRYNCLINLPEITEMDFITQMLVLSGMAISYDENGDFIFKQMDDFKTNLFGGNIYDWSNKISNIRKGGFQFNSNAQKNYLRFKNWEKVNYKNADYLEVADKTLPTEKDLNKIEFDIANVSLKGLSEFILYKQTSTSNGLEGLDLVKEWKNDYNSKDSVCVYNLNGIAINEYILPLSVENNSTITLITTRQSANVLNFSDQYEVDSIVPEQGNKVVSVDGVAVSDVYVIKREGFLLTLNADILSDTDEHLVTFDKSTIGFIDKYYSVHKKIINRPIVKEEEINLNAYESATFDFTKPIYIKEWGKYCMLLELTAPDEDLCTATLLLINQTL